MMHYKCGALQCNYVLVLCIFVFQQKSDARINMPVFVNYHVHHLQSVVFLIMLFVLANVPLVFILSAKIITYFRKVWRSITRKIINFKKSLNLLNDHFKNSFESITFWIIITHTKYISCSLIFVFKVKNETIPNAYHTLSCSVFIYHKSILNTYCTLTKRPRL
jgi:hypothetical protein